MTDKPLKKILLAEDDPDIQDIAIMSLADLGEFTVEVASNGAEALEKVEGFAPDLIILDVMMPEMDGPTALTHLRANPATKDIPVVFMTARTQPSEVREYIDQGAIGVIPKPFEPVELPDQVRELWDKNDG